MMDNAFEERELTRTFGADYERYCARTSTLFLGIGPRYNRGMGLTSLKVDVANVADPERATTLEFLVDSGTIYSVVPATVLNDLGIKPLTTGVSSCQRLDDCAPQGSCGVSLR